MNVVGLTDQNALIALEEVQDLIKDADAVYDNDARLCEEAANTKLNDELENADFKKAWQKWIADNPEEK
jgi:hypothetical protein